MSAIDPRLEEFIRLFNGKEFFEAHETLEALWIETEGGDKDFYKGLIQCAVAFVHLERGNFRGARKLFRSSCEYLHAYLPDHCGIHVEGLLEDFEEFFTTSVPVAERRDEPIDPADYDTPVILKSE